MARSQLRIFYGPEESTCQAVSEQSHRAHRVTVPVGEVLPLLADAVRSQRTWLSDFEDDEITISSDLYDVLLAYQHFRRPGA